MLIRLNLLFVQKQVTVERSNSVKVAETIISVFFGKGLTGFDSAPLSKKKNACRRRVRRECRARPLERSRGEDAQLLIKLLIQQDQFREIMEKQQNEIDRLKSSIEQFRSSSKKLDHDLEYVVYRISSTRRHLREVNSEGDIEMDED